LLKPRSQDPRLAEFRKTSRFREVVRMFFRNKPAVAGLVVFTAVALVALSADLIVDEELCYKVSGPPLSSPSAEHLLGTDQIGRDYFARIVHGSRVSILTGLIATIVSNTLGSFIGCACGYFGGWVDNLFMRVFDVLACIPGMLLTLVLVAILGIGVENIIYALAISFTPAIARSVRATVINLTEMEYVQCARSYGTNNFTIILRHVMPNAMGIIIVNAASAIAATILSAASFSYLGFGVQPPTPEWGSMVSFSRSYMRRSPHLTLVPGFAILIAAASINLVGDGLRDALDPRLRN
jgi:peptide/nickel transport system permease protein